MLLQGELGQGGPRKVRAVSVAASIVKQEGWRGLYAGLTPAIVRHVFYTGEHTQHTLSARCQHEQATYLSLAPQSAMSGQQHRADRQRCGTGCRPPSHCSEFATGVCEGKKDTRKECCTALCCRLVVSQERASLYMSS